MTAQLILFNKYTNSTNYNVNLADVEQEVYNSTKSDVTAIMDLATDFELQNEIPLFHNMPLNDKFLTIEDYNVPVVKLQTAVLRGMSRAIVDVRNETGKPLRIILGTVGRHFAFLDLMEQNGVVFDIIGYHSYPQPDAIGIDKDPWYGEGGALGQLAKFNKPIHINEYNTGAMYQGTWVPGDYYENIEGFPVTEKGFSGFYKHLNILVNQNIVNIEAIHFYEAYDHAQLAYPENHFGLYYDAEMLNPKISLLIASSFAGGMLSDKEKEALEKRNFIYYRINKGD